MNMKRKREKLERNHYSKLEYFLKIIENLIAQAIRKLITGTPNMKCASVLNNGQTKPFGLRIDNYSIK